MDPFRGFLWTGTMSNERCRSLQRLLQMLVVEIFLLVGYCRRLKWLALFSITTAISLLFILFFRVARRNCCHHEDFSRLFTEGRNELKEIEREKEGERVKRRDIGLLHVINRVLKFILKFFRGVCGWWHTYAVQEKGVHEIINWWRRDEEEEEGNGVQCKWTFSLLLPKVIGERKEKKLYCWSWAEQ